MGAQGANEQQRQLGRVTARIAPAVLAFCRTRWHRNKRFHMTELQRHVADNVTGTSPDSPSRILRHLRRQGVIDYEVENRRDSRYLLTRCER